MRESPKVSAGHTGLRCWKCIVQSRSDLALRRLLRDVEMLAHFAQN
jgi:hypothetical protein